MAKDMEYDVVVASMDAQMYVDFCVGRKTEVLKSRLHLR